MRSLLRAAGRTYLVMAAAVLPAAAGAALLLGVAVPAERRIEAWAVLAGKAVRTDAEAEFRDRRRQELDEIARRRDADFRARRAGLDGMERLVRAELARVEAERREIDRQRSATSPGGPFEATVELLNRVEPATAVALMKEWDDPTNSAYLRALRPSKAAEIVDRLSGDPAFKDRLPRILGKP